MHFLLIFLITGIFSLCFYRNCVKLYPYEAYLNGEKKILDLSKMSESISPRLTLARAILKDYSVKKQCQYTIDGGTTWFHDGSQTSRYQTVRELYVKKYLVNDDIYSSRVHDTTKDYLISQSDCK